MPLDKRWRGPAHNKNTPPWPLDYGPASRRPAGQPVGRMGPPEAGNLYGRTNLCLSTADGGPPTARRCIVTTTVMMPSSTEFMQAWRRQLGQRARLAERIGPRPFAVVSYRVRGPVIGGHVTLRQLTLVALFDERLESGELATRLVGVAGTVEADGVRFGGPALSRFDKNLRLAPAAGGRGARLDAADAEFLSFALQLERFLERCCAASLCAALPRPAIPGRAGRRSPARRFLPRRTGVIAETAGSTSRRPAN